MIAGSTDNGRTDTEYTPVLTKVAPPMSDVVAAHERVIVQLQNTIVHNSEELHQLRVSVNSLVARVYALEAAQVQNSR